MPKKTALVVATLLILTLGPVVAFAEVSANVSVGPLFGISNSARRTAPTDENIVNPTAGVGLRVGILGDHFDVGGALGATKGFWGTSTLSAGLYAGPSISLGRLVRVTVAATGGIQQHTGFGNEYTFADYSGTDVSLPYAGAAFSLWFQRAQRSKPSLGIWAEGRMDVGHAETDAQIRPECVLYPSCVLVGPPQPFSSHYTVGGASFAFGMQVRFGASAGPPPQGQK